MARAKTEIGSFNEDKIGKILNTLARLNIEELLELSKRAEARWPVKIDIQIKAVKRIKCCTKDEVINKAKVLERLSGGVGEEHWECRAVCVHENIFRLLWRADGSILGNWTVSLEKE